MKDIHTHILPFMDDGPRTKEESIEILNTAYQNGITDIIFTPHYIKNSIYNADNNQKRKVLDELKIQLKNNHIPIKLYLGNEVYLEDNLDFHFKNDICTLNNSKYILIELPLQTKFTYLIEILDQLKEKKLVPIIAHPERYEQYYKNFDFFELLQKKGCLFQGNIGSLYGFYGRKSKKMLKAMLKRNMIHFLGSDIHHLTDKIYQKPIKKDILKIVKNLQTVDNLLINNVDKVLKNEDILTNYNRSE